MSNGGFPKNFSTLSRMTAIDRQRHRGAVIWLTGLSGAGKSTIAQDVAARLKAYGVRAEILDGDAMRQTISHGLGFSKEDRNENVRRVGIAADHLCRRGLVVLAALISPYRAARESVRARVDPFIEVYVNAPLEICEKRDLKGLYRKARNGELRAFTGISDIYEPPAAPEVVCHTDRESVEHSARKVVAAVLREIWRPQSQTLAPVAAGTSRSRFRRRAAALPRGR